MNSITHIDIQILLFIQEYLRNPILTAIFKPITYLGNAGIFWIFFILLLFSLKKTRAVAIQAAISMACCMAVIFIIKNAVGRIRPFMYDPAIIPLVKITDMNSFPSGHTGVSFSVAWICFFNWRKEIKYWLFPMIMAILIAYSRLYLGVHYPSDVLTSIVLTFIMAYGVYKLYPNLQRKFAFLPKETKI